MPRKKPEKRDLPAIRIPGHLIGWEPLRLLPAERERLQRDFDQPEQSGTYSEFHPKYSGDSPGSETSEALVLARHSIMSPRKTPGTGPGF